MNQKLKIGIVLLAILSSMIIVSAIDYTTKYNPFTGKLDFVWDGLAKEWGFYNSTSVNLTTFSNQSGTLGLNQLFLNNLTNGTIYNHSNVQFKFINVSQKNITDVDCVIFRTGGTVCTGT